MPDYTRSGAIVCVLLILCAAAPAASETGYQEPACSFANRAKLVGFVPVISSTSGVTAAALPARMCP